MMKRLALLLTMFCGVSVGQSTFLLPSGGTGPSCNAIAAASSANPGVSSSGCASLALVTSGTGLPSNYTWQVSTTGTPASIVVNFMGSLDNVSWTQIDTTTAAGSKTVSNGAYKYLGCVPATMSGGSSPTITCLVSVSGGGGGGGGGGTTRTFLFAYQGVCQVGTASAPVNFPVTNSPSYVACDATHITPEWQIPSTNTTDTFWVKLRVPAGHTGAYTLTTTFRSAATSGAATLQPQSACVAAGAVPDAPSFANIGATITLTPAGTTLQNVTTTGTFTPTCADGSDLYIQYTFTANTVASPINFSYISLSVTGTA